MSHPSASKMCLTLWVPLFFVFSHLQLELSATVSHLIRRDWRGWSVAQTLLSVLLH
jgi:hypothetical protein